MVSKLYQRLIDMTARNNMRLMMKGDMAFFYHSNCKVPGIVGTMEIVQEHSVDGETTLFFYTWSFQITDLPGETAFDPEHPYFDEKSDREKPKWCLVHVKFVEKFPKMIKLKELQKFSKDGGILENMQVLKQTRLSVSKVTKKEWYVFSGWRREEVARCDQEQNREPTPKIRPMAMISILGLI